MAANLPLDIPSPCVKVCTMDTERGVCLGCYRTLDEIGSWGAFNVAQKLAVMVKINDRVCRWGPPPRPARDPDGTAS